jgi:DNA-binding MarR family transcriptional regulator
LSVDPDSPPRPLPSILAQVKRLAVLDMFGRMAAAGFDDVREGHGCVFGFIDLEEGSRLTDLADRAGLTKQAVGEAVAELQRLGYLERVPDPEDGRAKIIRLTPRGVDAALTGRRLFAEIENDWAARYGEDRVALLRELAEEIAAGYGPAEALGPAERARLSV